MKSASEKSILQTWSFSRQVSFERPDTNSVAHLSMLGQVDICLDSHGDSLQQLAITEDGEGVQNLTEWKLISEYWDEQPADGRLHIFVKPPTTGECALRLCIYHSANTLWIPPVHALFAYGPLSYLSLPNTSSTLNLLAFSADVVSGFHHSTCFAASRRVC
jgi:hypothetical protein